MSTTTTLAPVRPAFTESERLALAGYLAGYRGLTREGLHPGPAPVRRLVPRPLRAPVRGPAGRHRDLRPRARGQGPRPRDRDPPHVHHRRFCKYAVEEELLDGSPAAHTRRPRLDCESHATGLDRNEVGAILLAAGLGLAAEQHGGCFGILIVGCPARA
jgi:hypothetical protein